MQFQRNNILVYFASAPVLNHANPHLISEFIDKSKRSN